MVKKYKLYLITFSCLIFVFIIIANYKVEKATDNLFYHDLRSIPYNKVGLLLGTSKLLRSGKPNQYFFNRINSTFSLFTAHKIDFLVISGDNSSKDYNEPLDMKNELIKLGFPANKIFLDYAGFRTYDSIVRMRDVFGQQSFTIISQDFHNRRAIYLANRMNMKAVGFNAKDVDVYNGFKTKLREKLARVKLFVDLFFEKEPRFLGQTVKIG
jgi:SanA protein